MFKIKTKKNPEIQIPNNNKSYIYSSVETLMWINPCHYMCNT